jgi:uncharacterized protein YndB with AHSA1/START domain
MEARGWLEDDGATLAVAVSLPVGADVAWSYLAESDRLEGWFGTWTGDPESGSVMVTMNAEGEGAQPAPFTIERCDRPEVLAVSSSTPMGMWRLSVSLTAGEHTKVTLRHFEVPAEQLAMIAIGWEWYLDRLAAAVNGGAGPGLEEFETVYMALQPQYQALADTAG